MSDVFSSVLFQIFLLTLHNGSSVYVTDRYSLRGVCVDIAEITRSDGGKRRAEDSLRQETPPRAAAGSTDEQAINRDHSRVHSELVAVEYTQYMVRLLRDTRRQSEVSVSTSESSWNLHVSHTREWSWSSR